MQMAEIYYVKRNTKNIVIALKNNNVEIIFFMRNTKKTFFKDFLYITAFSQTLFFFTEYIPLNFCF